MQENKFKVGDKVRYIGKTIHPLKCGEEYTVCGLIGNFGILLTGVESWWNVWRFEIVESDENTDEKGEVMSKGYNFMVGDKIKYIGAPSYDGLNTGDVRVITDLQKYEGSDEIYGIHLEGVNGWVSPETLRLVKSAENADNMKEHSYSVEEVIEALLYAYPEGWSDTKWQIIADTKAELEKRKNPEYMKYLELKEKFG